MDESPKIEAIERDLALTALKIAEVELKSIRLNLKILMEHADNRERAKHRHYVSNRELQSLLDDTNPKEIA